MGNFPFDFINEEYYHVFNRGVEKRDIFLDKYDYSRFLKSIKEFNQAEPIISLYIKSKTNPVGVKPLQNDALVEIIAYNLLPNHFHLILKQLRGGGISEFMKRIGGGYTGYFNHKNKRSGSLFQGKFKAIHINTNEYLLYLSAYVNGNNFIHNSRVFESSLNNYLNNIVDELCNPKIILDQFITKNQYKEFVDINAREIKQRRDDFKRYLLEGE